MCLFSKFHHEYYWIQQMKTDIEIVIIFIGKQIMYIVLLSYIESRDTIWHHTQDFIINMSNINCKHSGNFKIKIFFAKVKKNSFVINSSLKEWIESMLLMANLSIILFLKKLSKSNNEKKEEVTPSSNIM